MEISAKVLADSISPKGIRLTTFECHYHRFILPEVNTHRALSKNGASSRAIPTEKLMAMCEAEKVEPFEWGLDQSGMQAFTHADEFLEAEGRAIWDEARADAIRHAGRLNEKGFAKQIVNRVMEPFLSTRTVLSGTDWANFNTLRHHKDAQPEFRELARCIIAAKAESKPRFLGAGDWHTPYILPEDEDRFRQWSKDKEFIAAIESVINGRPIWFETDAALIRCMVSAARAARASYRTVEGKPTDFEKDLELFKRLVVTQPVHASPTEHQATPYAMEKAHMTANYRGWVPFRRLIAGETVLDD